MSPTVTYVLFWTAPLVIGVGVGLAFWEVADDGMRPAWAVGCSLVVLGVLMVLVALWGAP